MGDDVKSVIKKESGRAPISFTEKKFFRVSVIGKIFINTYDDKERKNPVRDAVDATEKTA